MDALHTNDEHSDNGSNRRHILPVRSARSRHVITWSSDTPTSSRASDGSYPQASPDSLQLPVRGSQSDQTRRAPVVPEQFTTLEALRQDLAEKEVERAQSIKEALKDFDLIGGNFPIDSIEKARIIGLGNNHADEAYPVRIAKLLNSLANDGDIVLLENWPAHREVKQTKDDLTKTMRKMVNVFGWGDKQLLEQAKDLCKRIKLIKKELEPTEPKKDPRYKKLSEQYKDMSESLYNIMIIKRNKVLLKVLTDIQQKPPNKNKRIFIIAGSDHFTEDLQKSLATHAYILLQAKTTISPQWMGRRNEEYVNSLLTGVSYEIEDVTDR